MNLNMKKPCRNCPFLKVGAIDLREGRLQGIARDLTADDRTPFLCHKTVHVKGNEGEVIEDEEGFETHLPGPKSSICAGSMAFLMKARSPNVAMRMGIAFGLLDIEELRAFANEIIDPESLALDVH